MTLTSTRWPLCPVCRWAMELGVKGWWRCSKCHTLRVPPRDDWVRVQEPQGFPWSFAPIPLLALGATLGALASTALHLLL
ncbi:hypothetical protein LCGC14_1361850 [marine sediment metagenome]|uniref:Uncharacterized protein n=1 Tax=marine sediment metagenome TaxID=412755 RepID=A0A0F9K8G2_9ZZZZ